MKFRIILVKKYWLWDCSVESIDISRKWGKRLGVSDVICLGNGVKDGMNNKVLGSGCGLDSLEDSMVLWVLVIWDRIRVMELKV